MDELLGQFYKNEHERESVRNYLLQHLDSAILEEAYKGESTAGAQFARTALENAFAELKRKYGEPNKPITRSTR